MKKILLILFSASINTAIATEPDAVKQLKQKINLEAEKKLSEALEKTHQISTERMQRILEHRLKFEPKIVNGREANSNAYPWAVSIAYYDTSGQLQSYCGASLIAEKWLITAAHCDVYSSDVAIIGRHNLSTNNGKIYKIKRFIPHHSYNKTNSDNDIGLIELDSTVENTPTIKLANQDNSTRDGDNVTVIGWGRLSEGGSTSETLREVTIPLVSRNACISSYPNLTENMICAGEKEGGKDSCQGDSGGPLLIKKEEEWKQIGIVSFGTGCARASYYGVYTRVENYTNWINALTTNKN